MCAGSINLVFFACAISNEPLSPFITAVTQKEEVPPRTARRVGSTRRRPSFNCSLSDLLFPFFAALSRERLGFGFPPRRIGGQHLLGRPTHGWVHADDETLLGEHGFFRYRPDCLQVFRLAEWVTLWNTGRQRTSPNAERQVRPRRRCASRLCITLEHRGPLTCKRPVRRVGDTT